MDNANKDFHEVRMLMHKLNIVIFINFTFRKYEILKLYQRIKQKQNKKKTNAISALLTRYFMIIIFLL